MRRGNRIHPAFRSPLLGASRNQVVIGQHRPVTGDILGDGREVRIVRPQQGIGPAGNADESVVALGNAEVQRMRIDIAKTVGRQHQLGLLEHGRIIVQHVLQHRVGRHHAPQYVRGMPFAPLAKGADIDVFDARVAIVFFGQGLRELLRRPDIDGIVPDGSVRMVFCPAQINLDFLRAHLIDKGRSPVVFFLRREIALDKRRRVRQHAQGVSHVVLGKCVQKLFQFHPVVNALSRI